MLQETIKNRTIDSFEERLRVSPRYLKHEEILDTDTIHNHMPGNGLLGNKKAMFYCLK